MATIEDVRALQFCVETLVVREGRKLGRPRPDELGYYDIPVAVLGIPTENKTYYHVGEFVDQITNATSYVNRMLKDGKLYGEYGHPDIAKMELGDQLARLNRIDEERMSHHFRSLRTGDKTEDGGVLVVAKIKPHGPYGAQVQENLDNPLMNTAFSLRSIAQAEMKGGLVHRRMRKLVTYDYVAAGGYMQAAKRYSPAMESLSVAMLPNHTVQFTEAAMESLADSEFNDIFGTKQLTVCRETVTYLQGSNALIKQGERGLRDLYVTLMKR